MIAYLFMDDDGSGSGAAHKVMFAPQPVDDASSYAELCNVSSCGVVLGHRSGAVVRHAMRCGILGPTYPCAEPDSRAQHGARGVGSVYRPACVL